MSITRKTAGQWAALALCLSLSLPAHSQTAAKVITYPDGSRYTGETVNGKPAGNGKIQWANGDTYEGEWRNAQPHGTGKKTYLDGSVYQGEFVRGQQQGQGKLTYPDGTVYNGGWQSGAPNGQGRFAFQDGGHYEGAIYLGLPHGQGTFSYAHGDIYDGQWEHGKRSGRGTLRYKDGNVYSGQFENGHPQGTGTLTYSDGFRFKGPFSDGQPDGDGTCYKGDEQALCSYIEGEQIAYAVIPDYSSDDVMPAVDGPVQSTAQPVMLAANDSITATDQEQTSAKQAFVAALTDEKEKLKPAWQPGDLNPERSDILFHHNFESLELSSTLRTGWWKTRNSLFADELLLYTRSGDLELELRIKRFDGPGTYRIKPEQVQAWFRGKPLHGLKEFANTITIRNLEDSWLEGNINLSFRQKDTYGDHYKVENGVFRLNNEPIYQP